MISTLAALLASGTIFSVTYILTRIREEDPEEILDPVFVKADDHFTRLDTANSTHWTAEDHDAFWSTHS